MRAILYDVQWQKLRISFLKEFDPNAGWDTYDSAGDNLDKLYDYIYGERPGLERVRRI